jgi:DNA-binding transcriptional ArsR family regulator
MLLTAARPRDISINIEMEVAVNSVDAVTALGALAQEHRLAVFRLLVQAGESGMPAGAIAEALGVPNSSLSFHLAQLSRAGLIRQERHGRSLVYAADYATMNGLVGFMMENCCAGGDCSGQPSSVRENHPKPMERKTA